MFFSYNPEKIRKDFPVIKEGLIYMDSACMSLKPIQVIEKMNEYYKEYPACSGRSAHFLAKKVEEEIAKARNDVRSLINAKSTEEIIFTRNTTEGINLVANSLGLKSGDEVIISDKEHNSNLIPWLKLKKTIGIKVKIARSDDEGIFDLEYFRRLFTENTKLVSIVHTSNLDGVTNPIKEIAKIAHAKGALIMVDGAQAIPSQEVDVKDLDVDFLAFSGHKMLGPSGIGVFYGKRDLLEKLDQFLVGGETVVDSTYEDYTPEKLPEKFEAGLQDYAGIIGLGEACRYIKKIGLKTINKHEIKLNEIITKGLADEPKIELLGPKDAKRRNGIFSFNIKGMDPHHISRIFNSSKKIATRSGAHCVHSWFNNRNMKGSIRASLYLYNTEEEAELFVKEIKKLLSF